MKILVIGASGFIGKRLVALIKENSYHLLTWDITGVEDIQSDWRVFTQETRRKMVDFNPDCVINLAAITDLEGANLRHYGVNYEFSEEFVQTVNSLGCLYVHISTQLVNQYGLDNFGDYTANTLYGCSKAISEERVRRLFSKYLIMRPTSVWGLGMKRPYDAFFKLADRGVLFNSKAFEVYKSFSYVENLTFQVLFHIRNNTKVNGVKYLTDTPVKLSDWISKIAEFKGSRVIWLPKWFLLAIAKIGDFIPWVPYSTSRHVNMTTNSYLKSEVEGPFMNLENQLYDMISRSE